MTTSVSLTALRQREPGFNSIDPSVPAERMNATRDEFAVLVLSH
jgi:hypothetical protein